MVEMQVLGKTKQNKKGACYNDWFVSESCKAGDKEQITSSVCARNRAEKTDDEKCIKYIF